MSIDHLQNRIRKTKNPSVLEIQLDFKQIPPCYLPEEAAHIRFRDYILELLAHLKGVIPAVRFGFSSFAVVGCDGIGILTELLKAASGMDYYVILDAPEFLSPASAKLIADGLFGEAAPYCCDAAIISSYLGSDGWKPFLPYCENNGKDVFVVVRTGNKSAPELQDLLSGARIVHAVAADHVNRYGGHCVGKSGYSGVSVMASASNTESLRSLRSKYSKLFLLVDGYDYPSANAKNCAAAFDKLGHGAAVCAGSSIVYAWANEPGNPENYLESAMSAAERMKKNIGRYVTVL